MNKMYSITLRPIGTVYTKPRILYVTNFWGCIKILWHMHTALKATYGKNSMRDHEFDENTMIVHNQEFGDICRIELDMLDPEEFPDKAIPNV